MYALITGGTKDALLCWLPSTANLQTLHEYLGGINNLEVSHIYSVTITALLTCLPGSLLLASVHRIAGAINEALCMV